MDDVTSVHAGHRARMKDKFRRLGPSVFDSYELLEMLLYYAIPYRDTNPVAHRLIARFGSLDGVFSASVEDLCQVEGVKEKTALFLTSVAENALFGADLVNPFAERFDDYEKNGVYLTEAFADQRENAVLMLMLDNRLECIRSEWIANTDFDSARIQTPLFVRPALRYGASSVILAHNHPHGPLSPSVGDSATNNMIVSAFCAAGIDLIEHYIICGRRYYGFYAHARFQLHQSPELRRFLDTKETAMKRKEPADD